MRPSEALRLHRACIHRAVERNGAKDPHVSGSALPSGYYSTAYLIDLRGSAFPLSRFREAA